MWRPAGEPGDQLHRPPPRAVRCAARISGRPTTRPGWTGRSSGSTPRRARGCPETRARRARPQRPPNRGSRHAQPEPDHPASRDVRSCGSVTSGGATWRRSTACRTPRTRPSTTSAGPATRARAGSRATTATISRCARSSTRAAATTAPSSPTAREPGRAGRGVRRSAALGHGGGVQPDDGRGLSGRLRRRAVLRGLRPRLHLGDEAHRLRDLPNPAAISNFVERARTPSTSRWGRPGSCSTSIGTAARYVASCTRRGIGRRSRSPTSDVTNGELPLTVEFDGSTSDDPDSASPLSFAWDLDGDGEFDDSNSATPSPIPIPRPGPTRSS